MLYFSEYLGKESFFFLVVLLRNFWTHWLMRSFSLGFALYELCCLFRALHYKGAEG